ncbi:hypothetical protein [Streptomyces fumanus]|uniref:hypothetical protein n=1 Tax=Streptomyces fumanus TaxID=67302 RepID=UPI0033ECA7B6
MGQRTTDDVYEKVTDVERKVDSHHKTSVTTTYLDAKVKELKKAIEKGAPKEEKPPTWKDLVKEMSPVKEFLAVTKGGDLISQLILAITALVAAVGIVAGLLASFKKMTLAWTGRERRLGAFGSLRPQDAVQRQYVGRREDGSWGLRPEQPTEAAQPNLPSVQQINEVKQAMGQLNSEIGIYREKVRGLATPRAMRQMASAAKKLESAAKNHQNVSGLASSIGNLNREMRELAATAG